MMRRHGDMGPARACNIVLLYSLGNS